MTAWAVAPLSPLGVAQIPQQISDTCVLFSLLPKSAAKENQNKRERGEGGTIIIGNKRQTHDTSRCICWSSPKGACASGRGIWLLICTAFCLRFYGLWRLSALWFMLYLCLRFSPQLTRWLGVLFNWKPNCWHSKWERGGEGRGGKGRHIFSSFWATVIRFGFHSKVTMLLSTASIKFNFLARNVKYCLYYTDTPHRNIHTNIYTHTHTFDFIEPIIMLLKELHNCNFSQHLLIHRHLLLLCCLLCSFVALVVVAVVLLLVFHCLIVPQWHLGGEQSKRHFHRASQQLSQNIPHSLKSEPSISQYFCVRCDISPYFSYIVSAGRGQRYISLYIVGALIFYVCVSCFYSNCC